MGGAANEYARNQATQEGGGGLGFSGSNPALAPGYTAPQNYNPQNAAATWGQTENWTPPPQGLSPWGAPPPQPAQQATNNPLPAGAPSRARFLRESGVGPRPQAQNLPPQPPGFGTPVRADLSRPEIRRRGPRGKPPPASARPRTRRSVTGRASATATCRTTAIS